MGRIKSHITINIFYRTNEITPNTFFLLKYNKNKGRKKMREEIYKRRKK